MKKLFLTLILLFGLAVGTAVADNPLKVVTPNQSTIVWAPGSTLADGAPIPDGETMSFQIFLGPYPIPAGQDKNDGSLYTLLGQTTRTTYTITFAEEGVYLVGVRSVRTMDNVDVYSNISWSDDPITQVDEPTWYCVYIIPYGQPMRIHRPMN